MKRSSLMLAAGLALLAGCATTTDGTASASSPADAASKPAAASNNNTGAQVTQAAVTPLSDLNLVRADIPAALQAALKAPYAAPAQKTCPAMTADVQALDAALGADLDTPAPGGHIANQPEPLRRVCAEVSRPCAGPIKADAQA